MKLSLNMREAIKGLACLLVLVATAAHATNYPISAGASQSTIQTTINNAAVASGSNTVTFAAGTYSVASTSGGTAFNVPCPTGGALSITGPATAYPATRSARPTATLNNTNTGESAAFFYVNAGCSNAISITYLEMNGGRPSSGGGGIQLGGGANNVTIAYNYIHGNQEVAPYSCGDYICYDDDSGNAVLVYLNGSYATVTQNVNISWNILGYPPTSNGSSTYSGDCSNIMLWIGGIPTGYSDFVGYDQTGSWCSGVAVSSSTTNVTVNNNVIQGQEQGLKWFEGCQSGPSCYIVQTNDVVEYNDLSFIHRIVQETQQSPEAAPGMQWLYNDVHDPVVAAFGSWILSAAQNYYTYMENNVVIFNGGGVISDNPGSAEFWGVGNYLYNLVQGTSAGPACGMQYEFGGAGGYPTMQVQYNTFQGPTIGTVSNAACAEAAGATPAGLSPNVTAGNSISTSVTTFTSAAPTISPAAGSYASPQTITLTDNGYTSGNLPQGNTSIWYTTDGSTPVPGQGTTKLYTGPFSQALPVTIQAVGMWGAANQPTSYPSGFGFVPSAAVSAVYSSSGSGGGGGGPVTWNVKTAWGATGNGTTNDGPAIQAGAAKISAGDTVYFPTGTYLINNVVTFSAAANITCQAGAILQGPNLGTDVLSVVSNTTVGGSATTGCTFSGGGIQASGSGGDNSQTLTQAISNLTITYNTFENMTYATNNYRTNGGIMLGGGSNNVVIRYNSFSNIIPYNDGYDSAGTTYLTQYDPDGSTPRSAIWFYGASNLSIDHNTFSHDYQNITGCEAQSFQAQNLAIHHNYSYAHHRMFLQVNTGSGCGNPQFNSGIAGFAVYSNYDDYAGGPFAYSDSYGFSAPFATANSVVIPMSGVNWYNNVLKGQALNVSTGVGIGIEAGAQNMNVYNNAVMGQWAEAGAGYGGTSGGFMQNNYACLDQPAVATAPTFADEGNGATTITYQGNVLVGSCASGNESLSVSLGTVTDTGGTLTATATVSTVEYGLQGVVFAIDGLYVSAAVGAGPYNLNFSASGLSTGAHTVSATVVDAVGEAAVSNSQAVSTTNGVGPAAGPISPNVQPSSVVFNVAGNDTDPVNGATTVTLSSVYLTTPGSAATLIVGATLQFSAICVYTDGSTTTCNNADSHGNAVSTWSSSNTVAAAVSASGLATAAAAGTAVIQATVTGGIASTPWTLTINNAGLTLQSLALSTAGNVTSIATGATNQLSVQCNYSDGTSTACNSVDAHGNAVTSYTSSSPAAATVNAGGLVTGVAAGPTSLSAAVIPAPSQLGTNAYDYAGVTYTGYINEDYGVTGTAAGGYTPGTCYITLPGIPTAGAHWDCVLTLAPTPTTQASSAVCSGRYTTTGNEGTSPTIAISMAACPKLPADTAYWLGSTTDGSGAVPQGFTACGSGCAGMAPVFGSGTYPYYFQAVTFGTYTNMSTSLVAGGNHQVSQYLTLTTPALSSPTLGLTVTPAPVTLSSVTLSAAGGATTMIVGGTLQISATCHYSDGSTTSCQVADIHGNAVSAWTSSDTTKATIGAVGSAHPGLVTAVAPGSVTIQATVGSVHSGTYGLTISAPTVSLTNVTVATTGGVTSLALGATNQLVATCTYSDGSTTLCNAVDAHGNAVSSWSSSNSALATVSNTGLVTAVAPGSPTFTATAGGHTSPGLPLTISPLPPGTYTITIKGPVTITGTVTF